jgi:hypothetical protein
MQPVVDAVDAANIGHTAVPVVHTPGTVLSQEGFGVVPAQVGQSSANDTNC